MTRTVTVRRTVRIQQRRQTTAKTTLSQQAAPALHRSRIYTATDLANDGFAPIPDDSREFDLFLSHASEDKPFVRALHGALVSRGVTVWFDEQEIGVGDSLRKAIDSGLVRSRFGVVVCSHAFFSKRWTEYELNGLVAREMAGRKVLLPVWHPELGIDEVLEYSPSLADKKALAAKHMSIEQIADELAALIR